MTDTIRFRVITYFDTWHIEDTEMKRYAAKECHNMAMSSCKRLNELDMSPETVLGAYIWTNKPQVQEWQR